ncbi:MAG: aconitate hydratase [Eggerthellaceae bacterium]|nr:aconitate hydratase [Eggerthellaceae bacterium]
MAEEFRRTLDVDGRAYSYFPVSAIPGAEALPASLKVLVENVLRNAKDAEDARRQAARIVAAGASRTQGEEIEFCPARVLFQDFTGVPAFVDYAVMREACEAVGADPARINPQVPCNLVIDHSVIADEAGTPGACAANMALEATRNAERYAFLKWAQGSFENVEITPPGEGICHQLNIERFAQVVMTSGEGADGAAAAEAAPGEAIYEAPDGEGLPAAYFDTLVGTDSHTPTANGLGILGWGVGGIEAEAASLGQPITILVPRVVGVHLTGAPAPGITGMDVALRFANELRRLGVVGAFVECFGPGVAALTATQRTCIANMSPEYGCTATLFPVDGRTMDYLRLTGRSKEQCALVEAYAKAQGIWGAPNDASRYAQVLELDLASVVSAVAGPSRPHDLIAASTARIRFRMLCQERDLNPYRRMRVGEWDLANGAIAIAAVTSCTTATDPAMMIAAGLLARNAAAAGITAKPWVKTILAPGSHATAAILERAGLADGLAACGFYTCGFGCMSCIGNSGPLSPAMHEAASKLELVSVLSGNRNFEGRISPDVSQNYLMAPARVIAYALAGTMDFDFATDALGYREDGTPIYLRDIAPSQREIDELVAAVVTPELFAEGPEGCPRAQTVLSSHGQPTGLSRSCGTAPLGTPQDPQDTNAWDTLAVSPSPTFAWDETSTYVRKAPYFEGFAAEPAPVTDIRGARVLALLGDFITTDHISPAGSIAPDGPAAAYLRENGVAPADFNTYGSRRGNHEVMMRGTFANVKLQNLMTPAKRGGWTRDFSVLPGNTALAAAPQAFIFDAARNYAATGTPLVVVAGKMYGSGSSRDWAAKGPMLLGVRAVMAESFERIHRSNLIGMGILPLQFTEGESAASLGLIGDERFDVTLPANASADANALVGAGIPVLATRPDCSTFAFTATLRIDTPTEAAYYVHGGILPYVIRGLAG